MLKEIGTKARLEIEKLSTTKIFLKPFVRVAKNWTNALGCSRSSGTRIKRD